MIDFYHLYILFMRYFFKFTPKNKKLIYHHYNIFYILYRLYDFKFAIIIKIGIYSMIIKYILFFTG